MTPSDVQALVLERLGMSLGEEMTDYLLRRFQEGGAAAAPLPHGPSEFGPAMVDPVRRFAELAGILGQGAAVPAEVPEPEVQ